MMDVLNTHLPRLIDLAGNFDVDLSEVLAEYAKKLELEDFNFPEAALLLQRCSEVYGQKVDYVYNLAIELSENLNVRIYGSTSAQKDSVVDAKAVTRKSKRRKTDTFISREDFQLQKFTFDKPNTIQKLKKSGNHCREVMCVRLAPLNLRTSHKFHIYEDEQFASIGTKDQFRLNWSIGHNCRLEEYINDEGSRSVWNVMDVRVSSMPTPEYSDQGAPGSSESISETVPEPEPEIQINNPLSCQAICSSEPEADQVLGPNFTPINHQLPVVEKELIRSKVPFKLPYELSKKGMKEGKEEKNITLFLFSNMLKRELKIKGPLPPCLMKRDIENLVAKHVRFISKRFNLENGSIFNSKSLIEHQKDFHGFEEVVLEEVPEVLSHAYEDDSPTDLVEVNDAVRDICENDNFTDFQLDLLVNYNEKRRTTVDTEGVSNWKQFIQEKLAEPERKFDVHEYSTDIIDSFQNIGQTLSFQEIVKGKDAREISRYFVSSLMLANTTNVTLDEDGPNTLRVTLNHRQRDHEMENFLVPPSVGGLESQSKRRSTSPVSGEIPEWRKQVPGQGPWKNKSKKRREK